MLYELGDTFVTEAEYREYEAGEREALGEDVQP